MQLPEGYRSDKNPRGTRRGWIQRALRESDGAEVVLKGYAGDLSSRPGGRAEREFEALRAVAPGCAVRALDLDRSTLHPVLVLEEFPGDSVQGRLDPAPFLDFAVRAARALAGVHGARYVHRGLHRENFLVHPRTGEVRLTGFTRAAPLGAPVDPELCSIDAPLRYLAPETSGRTGRGVDARSDLYALGAIFYDLLTGLAPFEAVDPLELIQAHIARRPRPPLELCPSLPPTLARIVLRLIEKEPEDRYQTAEALEVDLQSCREQLARTGRIDDTLPLGSADAPYRPLFRRTLWGREAEVGALLAAYRRCAAGANERLAIRGAPGIGKSALVLELHRPLALDGGYLVQGKFDLYRHHLPYAGFASALHSLCGQIASESQARRAAWKAALLGGLGELAGALLELVPELSSILDELPAVPALPPAETQARLALAVQRFVCTAAAHARPLVLFLDDLQWADAGSAGLLDALLRADASHCLLLCTYREGEVAPGHPFARLLERAAEAGVPFESLELGPLSQGAATQMLADALGHPPGSTQGLAAQVAAKSGNVPLLMQHCVYQLHQLGVIRFERGRGWGWDDVAVAAAQIPDDALGMMVAKLRRLAPEVRQVIQIGSCIGDCFDAEMILDLHSMERRALEAALYALCDEGLIAPGRAGFQFVHDRIREAARSLLSERERAALHREAAKRLVAKLAPAAREARALEIADHWIQASAELSEEERVPAIEIELQAGQLALCAGVAATAARYLESALELYRETDWEERAELGFSLYWSAADCASQTREFDRALARLDVLERRPLEEPARAAVAAKRISVHILRDGPKAALPLVLETLGRFGLHIPARPSWLRTRLSILWTDWLLRGPLDESVFRPPVAGSERRWVGPVLLRASSLALGLSVRLNCIALGYHLRMYRRCGVVASSPALALAGYAHYRRAFLGHIGGLSRYTDAALRWADCVPDVTVVPYVHYVLHGILDHWTRPYRDLLEPLRTVAEAFRQLGNAEYTHLALAHRATCLALAGEPLDRVEREYAQAELARGLREDRSASVYERALDLLRGTASPEALARQVRELEIEFRKAPGYTGASRFIAWREILCMLGQHRWAGAAAESELIWLRDTGGLEGKLASYLFAWGLCAASLARATRAGPRIRHRRALRHCWRTLRTWAGSGPDFAHMAQALAAERARIRGRTEWALAAYERAAARALQQGYRHHAALLHERRAGLLVQLGRPEQVAPDLQRAIALYDEWGARGIAQMLRTTGMPRG